MFTKFWEREILFQTSQTWIHDNIFPLDPADSWRHEFNLDPGPIEILCWIRILSFCSYVKCWLKINNKKFMTVHPVKNKKGRIMIFYFLKRRIQSDSDWIRIKSDSDWIGSSLTQTASGSSLSQTESGSSLTQTKSESSLTQTEYGSSLTYTE